jgi:AraC-like DNA-binding protein
VLPASPRAFLATPFGRYVVGRTWLHFSAHERFAGCVLWGELSRADVSSLAEVVPATHTGAAASHAALLDARRVESVDPEAFPIMTAYVEKHRQSLAATVQRFAIVRPEGFAGAIAGGFFKVVPAPYPVEVFDDAVRALAWLGCERDTPLLGELDELQRVAHEATALLGDLRAVLAGNVRGATIDDAARELNVSVRTLQRRLAKERTSFQNELLSARVQAAQRRMLESDASLAQIATDVGFASAAHLSVQFRKRVGAAPSEWRARRGG